LGEHQDAKSIWKPAPIATAYQLSEQKGQVHTPSLTANAGDINPESKPSKKGTLTVGI
jgi:hypothetical protein